MHFTVPVIPVTSNFQKPSLPLTGPWMRYDFAADIARWNTMILFYLDSPGFVVFPPTQTEFNRFVHRMADAFGHALQRLVVRCGYGLEVEEHDIDGEYVTYQTLEGTPWESRIEGVNDYFLPGGNLEGGIYEIRRGSDGNLVGRAGSFVEECGWLDDYETTFDF
jgi:hypothetical protein